MPADDMSLLVDIVSYRAQFHDEMIERPVMKLEASVPLFETILFVFVKPWSISKQP